MNYFLQFSIALSLPQGLENLTHYMVLHQWPVEAINFVTSISLFMAKYVQ